MLKIAISFISGAIICFMVVLAAKSVLPASADESGAGDSSSNTTGLLQLIPNFDKIYRDSLAEPFIKAESKIQDPDIAEYYHGLMQKTGLTNTDND